MLYLVSTPIGNLEDITLRAISTLKSVDYIVCEDTRHSQKLLQKYDISKPLLSFHSYSPQGQINKIMDLLTQGKNMALISDAGTPILSDPGYELIQAAITANIPMTTIPGPSALLAALPLSGLPMDRFLFIGFLPVKKRRKSTLEALAQQKYTLVIYESPHRLLKTLREIVSIFGEKRPMAICRELTKLHEEVIRATAAEVLYYFENHAIKGEFVIVVKGIET